MPALEVYPLAAVPSAYSGQKQQLGWLVLARGLRHDVRVSEPVRVVKARFERQSEPSRLLFLPCVLPSHSAVNLKHGLESRKRNAYSSAFNCNSNYEIIVIIHFANPVDPRKFKPGSIAPADDADAKTKKEDGPDEEVCRRCVYTRTQAVRAVRAGHARVPLGGRACVRHVRLLACLSVLACGRDCMMFEWARVCTMLVVCIHDEALDD